MSVFVGRTRATAAKQRTWPVRKCDTRLLQLENELLKLRNSVKQCKFANEAGDRCTMETVYTRDEHAHDLQQIDPTNKRIEKCEAKQAFWRSMRRFFLFFN